MPKMSTHEIRNRLLAEGAIKRVHPSAMPAPERNVKAEKTLSRLNAILARRATMTAIAEFKARRATFKQAA